LELKKELFIKRHNKPLSDDYFIHKKLLGEGSFGCVYLGYKLNPKSDLRAIKIIKKNKILD
jgi:serine/threonine protein kinase